MKKSRLKFIIGGILIVGIVIWIFGSISSENLTYYYTPSEVLAPDADIGEETVRVMGVVETGSIVWDHQNTRLQFRISDDDVHYLEVEYFGAKPDMFKEGQGVVVEGAFRQSGFLSADALLVKHSEEYKVNTHTEKKEDYYKSLQN